MHASLWLTKPRHPWTNGRIERLFRTFKETIFAQVPLLFSITLNGAPGHERPLPARIDEVGNDKFGPNDRRVTVDLG
jgi:transposase InsO family protein